MTLLTLFTHTHIVKRDGTTQAFDAAKIASALLRAGLASGEFSQEVARKLAAISPTAASKRAPAPK